MEDAGESLQQLGVHFLANDVSERIKTYKNFEESLKDYHLIGYIHSDVKTPNLVVNKYLKGFLIDYGCSIPIEN